MADSNSVDIDMTPMIDIVFQLITFFMVVINFDAADTDERVKMAVSEVARPPKVKPETELTLNVGYYRRLEADGTVTVTGGPYLFYTGEDIPPAKFESVFGPRLKREYEIDKIRGNVDADGNSKTIVVIRADSECPTGVVQKLIRLCQQNKYEKFSLKAMQPEG
jgi:biopolymer transport protein ExbD